MCKEGMRAPAFVFQLRGPDDDMLILDGGIILEKIQIIVVGSIPLIEGLRRAHLIENADLGTITKNLRALFALKQINVLADRVTANIKHYKVSIICPLLHGILLCSNRSVLHRPSPLGILRSPVGSLQSTTITRSCSASC